MTTSFRAIVLNLVALESGILTGALGELAHAAFYATIQAVNPDLSQRMHDAQERASFTLSPLNGFVQNHKERTIRFTTGDAGWLRITLLDDQLADAFYQHLMGQALPTIRLGEMHLGIASVFGAPGSHPWSGFTTVDALRALNHPR
ncbi:MAG: hypothetical protein IPK16_18390 [Anaerolineales bacterium]|nr:hypothetical protein [Anaerolineales bacterium]